MSRAIAEECKRFEAAVSKTDMDLEDIKRRIHPDFTEHAQVLEVYQMILARSARSTMKPCA